LEIFRREKKYLGEGRKPIRKNLRYFPDAKGFPLLFTVENSIFCHPGVRMAKNLSHEVCHFEFCEFFEMKCQKRAKLTVNSRELLCFRRSGQEW
jgi:hypothetical protein